MRLLSWNNKEIRKEMPLSNITKHIAESQVEYEALNDNVIKGICIYNDGDIAIQKAFMPKGCEIKKHKHDVIEILKIVTGKLKFLNGTEDGRILEVGDQITIPTGQRHSVLALEETWVIGITMPADPAYPKARSGNVG